MTDRFLGRLLKLAVLSTVAVAYGVAAVDAARGVLR